MSSRNTLLFGAALAVSTVAIAADHLSHPVPPRPQASTQTAAAGAAPCAAGTPAAAAPCAAGAAPCAAGAPAKLAAPPPPAKPAADAEPGGLAAPPPLPKSKPAGSEAPDLLGPA
jgi:hypothetical protein